MLPVLALVALIADPHAARSLTATTGVEPGSALQLQWQPFTPGGLFRGPFLDLSSGSSPSDGRTARARLGLEGTFGSGRFASALTSSLARWSLGIGFDAETLARPGARSGAPSDGLLVARIGHGLYLGHAPLPRPALFTYQEQMKAKPSLSPTGVRIGIDGTLFFTPHLGLHFEVSGGGSWFGGLSFVYRPGK
jgi:hypothetical protein